MSDDDGKTGIDGGWLGKCWVADCTAEPAYEAWARMRDPVTMQPRGHLVLVTVCEEHRAHPWLCANETAQPPANIQQNAALGKRF